jgi:hypothetical protein
MRALLRLLLLGLLVAFLVHAVRRAFAAAREPKPPRMKDTSMPELITCGSCGHEFDAEQSGWLCPKCGK